MEERMKDLLQELGESINDAVSRSPRVQAVVEAIRDSGYAAYLTLEANISAEDKQDPEDPDYFTNDDRNFLRRLRIEC